MNQQAIRRRAEELRAMPPDEIAAIVNAIPGQRRNPHLCLDHHRNPPRRPRTNQPALKPTEAHFPMHPAFTTHNLDRIHRLDWQNDAACADPPPTLTPANWFPEHGTANTRAVRNAKRICETCPVRGDCLVHALVNDQWRAWGIIAGGYGSRQRRDLRTQLQATGAMPVIRQCVICGTFYAVTAWNVRRSDARCSTKCRKARMTDQQREAIA